MHGYVYMCVVTGPIILGISNNMIYKVYIA